MNLAYLFAELTRRPGRTLSAVLSVASGVALFVSLQAYATGYREAARAPLAEIGADIAAQRQGEVPEAFVGIVFPHSTAPIHQEEIEAVHNLPGVEAVGEAVLFWDFEPEQFLVVLGLDAASATGPGRLRAAVTDGRFLEAGEPGMAAADVTFAREKDLHVGDQVFIGGQPFTLVGLVDTRSAGQIANANLYIPLADAHALAHAAPNVRAVHDFRADDANLLFIKANQAETDRVIASVTALLGKQALVSSAHSFSQTLGAAYRLVDRFSGWVGIAGLFVATAGLLRAMLANAWERRRDVGVMRAVGWRWIDIVRQLMGEIMALASTGVVAGLIAAALISFLLSQTFVTVPVPWELSPTPHFLAGGAKAMAVTIHLPAQVHLAAAVTALALAWSGSVAVTIGLAVWAARIKPAEVLRSE